MIETYYSWSQPYEPCYSTVTAMFQVANPKNINCCHLAAIARKHNNKAALIRNLPSAIDDEYSDDGIYTSVDWIMTMMEVDDDNTTESLSPKDKVTNIVDTESNNSAAVISVILSSSSHPSHNHSNIHVPQEELQQRRSIVDWSNLQDVASAPIVKPTTSNPSTSVSSVTHAKNQKKKKKNNVRVSFSTTEIREYAIVVGDHPWCQEGLPLSLDWKYNQECITTIDLRNLDGASKDNRPGLSPLSTPVGGVRRLTYYERKNRLRQVSGFTERQLRHLDEKRRLKQQEEKMIELGIRIPMMHRHESSFDNLAKFN